jgi:hypothetical protein
MLAMDAFLQFLTGEFTVQGMTFQNWMPIILVVVVIWITINRATTD